MLEEQRGSAEVERVARAEVAVNNEPAAEVPAATGTEEQAWIVVERAVAAQGEAVPCCGPVAAPVSAQPWEQALFPVALLNSADAAVAARDAFRACLRCLLAASGPDG